jgi:snRNA-activating protein complex subunit 3
MQEFLVLGSQSLCALKDAIACAANTQLDGEHTLLSGAFFIENCFYNDTRAGRAAVRYSDPIIDWVKQERRYTHIGLAHFDTAVMEQTVFYDLSIRLGSHYQFMHQGDCTHVIIFTDMRIAHPADINNVHAYPLRPFQAKSNTKRCRVNTIIFSCMLTVSEPGSYCGLLCDDV